jgi:hypothetical protein
MPPDVFRRFFYASTWQYQSNQIHEHGRNGADEPIEMPANFDLSTLQAVY